MRHSQFGLVISSLKTGILVVALCLQMLPFLFFIVVVTHSLGVSSGGLLVVFPVFFFVVVFAVCWLASKQTRRLPTWPPPKSRRTANRPVQNQDVLIKTRAERYQDLKEALMGDRP
ncbi:MAG: hypothetical protein ACE5GT_03570 [Rhodospirillales bacterium]